MADAATHGHDHDERGFFTRWFMSTNHKDIGILYLFAGGLVGLISVIFTVYMRMELMNPGVQYICVWKACALSLTLHANVRPMVRCGTLRSRHMAS